jgi:hypothetical protein
VTSDRYSSDSSVKEACAAEGLALITRFPPRSPNMSRLRRKISRRRRRTRLRSTEPPTRRGTERPSLGRFPDSGGDRRAAQTGSMNT